MHTPHTTQDRNANKHELEQHQLHSGNMLHVYSGASHLFIAFVAKHPKALFAIDSWNQVVHNTVAASTSTLLDATAPYSFLTQFCTFVNRAGVADAVSRLGGKDQVIDYLEDAALIASQRSPP